MTQNADLHWSINPDTWTRADWFGLGLLAGLLLAYVAIRTVDFVAARRYDREFEARLDERYAPLMEEHK